MEFLVIAATEAPPLPLGLRLPLSIMNFLEFAIWGAWFVVLGNYLNTLGFSRKDIGSIYATMSLGTVIAPMFIGTIADRYFASQQLMGVLHLAGAGLLFWMAHIHRARLFYWVALLYALVYAPTLALVNSVVFANLQNAERDFGGIRVLGTIGWIAAGLSLKFLLKPGQPVNNRPLLLAATLSATLGVYSFFLPDTPPPAAGSGAEAQAVMAVGTIEVTDGGSDYTRPPQVSLTGGGGSGAQAEAVVENGQVTGVRVTEGGSGYTTAPEVTFNAGDGSGAEATATLEVTRVDVVQPGSGYRVPPAITIGADEGSGAVATSTLSDEGTVEAIHVTNGGSGYISVPYVSFPAAEIPFVRAFELLKEPSFAIFFGVSFLITIALAFYYSFTALFLEQDVGVRSQNVGPLMTIGQFFEIVFLLLLGWFLAALGMKWVLIVGMAAWGLRYALFSLRRPFPLILIGIALHGICFDFFFAAGFVHVENTAPSDIQASAQSLFAVLTYGLGMYLGTEASGWLNQAFTREEFNPATGQSARITDWRRFWLVPCVGVLVSLALFVILFRMPAQ